MAALREAKAAAVEAEDYDEAKRLKSAIDRCFWIFMLRGPTWKKTTKEQNKRHCDTASCASTTPVGYIPRAIISRYQWSGCESRAACGRLAAVGGQLGQLEAAKADAIAREDYDAAKALKVRNNETIGIPCPRWTLSLKMNPLC